MKEKSVTIASTLAAFLASLCCLGPLLLGGAGLSAVLVATFAPLRPYFLAASAILLAGGFYFVYRKPKATEACTGKTCAPQNGTSRMAKSLLWLASAAVVALAFFPSYGVKLVRNPAAAVSNSSATLETAEFRISGMDCEVCASVIRRKLLETPGVLSAEVRYRAGSATVQFDPARTNIEKLIAVVKDTGYEAAPASSAQRGDLRH